MLAYVCQSNAEGECNAVFDMVVLERICAKYIHHKEASIKNVLDEVLRIEYFLVPAPESKAKKKQHDAFQYMDSQESVPKADYIANHGAWVMMMIVYCFSNDVLNPNSVGRSM
jgi:hypothetical protein